MVRVFAASLNQSGRFLHVLQLTTGRLQGDSFFEAECVIKDWRTQHFSRILKNTTLGQNKSSKKSLRDIKVLHFLAANVYNKRFHFLEA